MATASEEALRAIFEQIRDERKTHANTATRIGDAFLALLSHLDNGTFLKQGDTESTEYILSVTGGASASLTKLFTLETVTEQGEERVTLATPLAPFKELELRDYLQIGDARLRWDSERQALYVIGKDGSTPVGFYSTGWISAKGANDGEGEGGGGISYSRLDTWEGYSDEEKGGWVLSAYLGVRLHQDIENLKNGVAMSYAVTGTGNAITDVTRDGSRWVFTKGKTFSELGHTHKLSDISDLNSSWDSLLKEAPSAYITRWPSWTEVKDKPSTFTPSSHKHVKADITDFPATWAWSAISGKPTTFTPSAHQHPLSDLSDLHSSWDAILKAAPFAGVSRWPSWGEVTGKPTSFTPSSHTHAISQVSGLQSALDAKLPAATFEELFEKVTLSTGETAIRAKLGLYSDKWLSAKGANPNQGEGGGFSYTRLDTWEGYDSATMDGWVLSAKLGYSLYNDVKSLKAGAAVSFTIEGTGNAITDISKDGTRLVFTRGTTFALSSHQHLLSNISDLHSSWDAVLKAQKPNWLTSVSLATISDLHSNWDALLKAAPSAYVTRWPSFSEVTSKPTTLGGYGITDAALKDHTHSQYLTGITKSMVEAVLTGNITSHTHSQYLTSHQAIYALSVKAGSTSVLSYSPKTAAASLTLKAGTNVSLSADATNHAVTINSTYTYTHPSATATTIAAATGRVLSAITVNGLGHVTSVAAKTLAAADIPTLAISKISGLQGSLDSKLAKATFDDLFEKVTLSDGTVAIHAKYGFYSDGFVSGKGANPSAGEGGGTAYNRLDTWDGYSDALAGWVLSAGLGYSLYNDVKNLKQGAAVSLATISDLHSSWDALLKAAPSAYVTRWPNFSEVGSKPTTLAGYGITDAPTKTGSGASGTWGISISGSAALAGFLNKNTAFNYSGQAGLQYYDAEMQSTANGNAWSGPSKGWHQILHMPLSVANYFTEIALPVNDVNGLAWRQRRSNSYYGWYRLLDSANYTSYTVTKTGGGASGTWGIGISGNAATASKWAAKRTISLTGAVTGSVSLDGSGNVSLATTYAAANISALDSRYVNVSGDTMTGTLTLSTNGTGAYNQGLRINRTALGNWATLTIGNVGTATSGSSANTWLIGTPRNSNSLVFNLNAASESVGLCLKGHGNTDMKWNNQTVWHAGNDGSGSGLDADTLDGTHKSGLFTAFSANGNSTRLTIGGVTKDLTVPYAKNCDTLDGLHGSSFMACNGLNGISLTGGNGNTEGYRLVIQKTMTGWSINNLVLVVASRHNGQGILSVAFHITADSPSSYSYSIRYFGANLALMTPFRAFYNTSTHVFRLYWHYRDCTSTAINVLRVEGFPSPSNGTWYEAMPSDNGTELTIEYNNADTIGGTSKGGLLTSLSSSSGTNLSLTVGGTTKTVADLYATAAEKLLTARTINGTSFNGTANIVTSYWGTARNISIASSNGGGAGSAVSVNGSGNVTLKLPATITAALSGNASSASKLQTARTLWGRSFDGSANVSGDLSGVGSISASGVFSTSKATNTYLAGNQGQALVNSTASAGAYVMLHRGCSTNGYFTLGTYQDKYLLQYTAKSTVTAGNNSVTKSLTLLNEAGNSIFPGTLHASGGIYSDQYVSAKGQNTSSDMRLKRVLGDVSLPLERIAKAPSFEFRWRDGSGESAGSSAQYWKEALPSAVRERGGYLEMQYGNIALLSAISIARETMRVDREVARLREECRRLRRRVARLEEAAGTRHLTAT
jgi:hypothetical protein